MKGIEDGRIRFDGRDRILLREKKINYREVKNTEGKYK